MTCTMAAGLWRREDQSGFKASPELRFEMRDRVQGGVGEIVGLIAKCSKSFEPTPAQERRRSQTAELRIHAGADRMTDGVFTEQYEL